MHLRGVRAIVGAAAFLSVAASGAESAEITLGFYLYGEVLTPPLGFGDVDFEVSYNHAVIDSGGISYDGTSWSSSGMLTGAALSGQHNTWSVIDLSFSSTINVDPVSGGLLQMSLNTGGVRMPIDFANRYYYLSAPASSGRQGLTVTSVTGGTIAFIPSNTVLSATSSEEGGLSQTTSGPATIADTGLAYAWVTGVTNGIYNLSAFTSYGGSIINDMVYDIADAAIGAADPRYANIQLISSSNDGSGGTGSGGSSGGTGSGGTSGGSGGSSSIPAPSPFGVLLPGVAMTLLLKAVGKRGGSRRRPSRRSPR